MKLIKYKDNWADEMNIAGFGVLRDDQWDFVVGLIEKYFETNDTFTLGVGSNEEIEYESLEELMETFTVIPIGVNEKSWLETIFKGSYGTSVKFGQFPIDQIIESMAYALEESGNPIDECLFEAYYAEEDDEVN